jgi:hypothetical protein
VNRPKDAPIILGRVRLHVERFHVRRPTGQP